jgi:hypothetical protein
LIGKSPVDAMFSPMMQSLCTDMANAINRPSQP